jgi:hypothetical protein
VWTANEQRVMYLALYKHQLEGNMGL